MEACFKLPDHIFLGVDRARGKDKTSYCEMRQEPDGKITVLDYYELPFEIRKQR